MNDTPTPSTEGHELKITWRIAAPRAVVWRCWTEPELLMRWYCPRPWRVTVADIDPRPGGRANVTMQGPDGTIVESVGCYLEVVPMERLAFTDAFSEGFMPRPKPFMVGFTHLSDDPDGGTVLIWGARHWNVDDQARHEAMGFHEGWTAAAAQLDELARRIAADTTNHPSRI